jgi:hypothetical protein
VLRSVPLARLAYVGRDETPRVISIGFHWNGQRVVVCTATTAPKVPALAERPHVALTIDADAAASRSLLIRGVAAIETVDGVPPEYIAAATKALNDAEVAEFEAKVRGVCEQMARISVTPHWARLYDFASGRVPEFLRRLGTGGQHAG